MAFTPEDREDPKLGLAAEMLRSCGVVHLELRGTSMLPSLWPGDLLTIQSADDDEIVPGDIVLVLRHKRFFVHRVVERRRAQDRFWWITRGDAIPDNDLPVSASELLGLVTGIRRANRSCVPSRRVSMFRPAVARMLHRSDRFRNITLRIHAVCLRTRQMRAGHFLGSIFGAVRGIPGISPSRISHP